MAGHNIIVIGTSAGGLKALSAVLSRIPTGLGATIFVVQHLAPNRPSLLPKLLADICDLPVSSPSDNERFVLGQVYVAAPDHHLLVNEDHVRVLRGHMSTGERRLSGSAPSAKSCVLPSASLRSSTSVSPSR